MSKNKEITVEELLQEVLVPVEDQPYRVPEKCVWVKSEYVAKWGSGGTPSRKNPEYYGGDIPWIKTGDLRNGIITEVDECITDEGLKKSSAKMFPKDSVVIAMYGATIGKLGILGVDATTNQACAVGVPLSITTTKFLFYYFLSQKDELISLGKGGAQPNISQQVIKQFPFALPPLAEQERIVQKTERLLNKINQAKQLIEEAKETFELRRAAILDKAFRGELTLNKQYIKSDIVLNIGKGVAIDDGKSEELRLYLLKNSPKSWEIHSLGSILRENTGICYGIVQTGNDTPNGIPTVRAGDLKNDYFEIDNLKKVDPEIEKNYPRSRLRGGEVLISIRGSVGYVGIPTNEMNGINVSREVGLIPLNKSVKQKFLSYYIQSPLIQGFLKKITKGVAQQGINLNQLRTLPVPIPSILEQEDIVNELDGFFAKEKLVNQDLLNFNNLDILYQSILSRAFRGELGTNEPTEESSEELLKSFL